MRMKSKIINFILACTTAVAVNACAGNVDPGDDGLILTLKADMTEVVADGASKVTFTVMNGDEDVTSASEIRCITTDQILQGGIFSPESEGAFVFVAHFNGKSSNEVTVNVVAPEIKESRFQRHVCVMEVTGTKCAQCPEGAEILSYLVNRAYKGKAFALAFHNSEEDPYHIPEELKLKSIFNYSGYPSFITDMRDCGELKGAGCGNSIEKSLYDVPTHCGVAVSCTYDKASATVTVKAKVYSEKTMPYRMAAYVVEDGIKGSQLLSTGSVQKDYVHHHVVRKMLSADVRGDSLGEISVDKESEKEYSFKVDAGWEVSNLSVAVLALDKDTHVNNMAVCAVDGGNMDYEMIK